MKEREALKLALEALVEMTPSGPNGSAIWHKQMSAITAASEALAQPEQEPVAIVIEVNKVGAVALRMSADVTVGTRLYTTPPQRKPLTDEEIGAILEGVNAYGTRLYTFARAIEAKLKEKNGC